MIKRFTMVALVLLVAAAAVPAMAQDYRSNLIVMVSTESGDPVVGAPVKVVGDTITRTVETNDRGMARFIRLEPGSYSVEIAEEGYNIAVYQNVRLNQSATVEFPIALQKSQVSERVVVTSRTPVLDRRDTGTGAIIDPDEINKVPTARDPWAVLATIPGVQADRVNVGGNQSGQQSAFVGKGDNGDNATWVMDGVEFTDLSAEGGSATYFDWNSFEEIGFTTGGGDVEQLTPGQRLNFVTKQGANRHTGAIGIIATDAAFQDGAATFSQPDGSSNRGNQINEIQEVNFEIGGPIAKDKAFYWFGYSQNDIDTAAAGGTPDRTKLQNLTGKINGNVGDNLSWKAFYTRGDKIKDGRGASPTRPAETTWDQSGPSPIYTGELSYFFSPQFELSGAISTVEGGFQLIPKGTADQVLFDETGVWQNTFISYMTDRPTDQYTIRGNWFTETGRASHEFKFGVKRKEGTIESASTYGNQNVVANLSVGEDRIPADPDNDRVTIYRPRVEANDLEYTSAWIGDTILLDNWTFNLGVLYMTQEGQQSPATLPANGLRPDLLPALTFGGFDPGFEWEDLMPRLGVNYQFDTAKRILVRAQYGQYVDQLANGNVGFNSTAASATIAYPWNDTLGSIPGVAEIAEIDFGTIESAGNVDPANPTDASAPIDLINTNLEAPRVDEILIGAEIELMPDFSLGLNITNRERDRELWEPLADLSTADPFDIISSDNWALVDPAGIAGTIECFSGTAACSLPGIGDGFTIFPYFLDPADTSVTNTSRPEVLSNRPGYSETFEGIELVATKRLSNNWSLRGFFAWQDWTRDVPASAIQDPTQLVGGINTDGSDVAIQSGGSGPFDDVFLGTATWQYNINGVYQLPHNFEIAANLNGREGFALPIFQNVTVSDFDSISPAKSLQINDVTAYRVDDLHTVDLRLGYLLQLSGDTTVNLNIEFFNLFDEDTVMQFNRRVGTSAGRIAEVLSPRIYRFGARINF